jgi:hypothetical protein
MLVAVAAAAGGKSALAFPLAPMSDKGGGMDAPPYPPKERGVFVEHTLASPLCASTF